MTLPRGPTTTTQVFAKECIVSLIQSRPEPCLLINTHSGESMEPLINPDQLTEAVQVRYTRHQVPGLSFQPLQYEGTTNRTIKGFEFIFDRLIAAERDAPDIREFRSFMRALTVPPAGSGPGPHPAPPHVLLIWGEVVTLEAVVLDLEFHYRLVDPLGGVRAYTAICNLEAVHFEALSSEQLREEI